MTRIPVIHANETWIIALLAAFARIGVPFREVFVDRSMLDLRAPPPKGLVYNRMSASSHTRGHRFAAEHARAILAGLHRHGRRVVNRPPPLALEVTRSRSTRRWRRSASPHRTRSPQSAASTSPRPPIASALR
jgi:hypothetical protein